MGFSVHPQTATRPRLYVWCVGRNELTAACSQRIPGSILPRSTPVMLVSHLFSFFLLSFRRKLAELALTQITKQKATTSWKLEAYLRCLCLLLRPIKKKTKPFIHDHRRPHPACCWCSAALKHSRKTQIMAFDCAACCRTVPIWTSSRLHFHSSWMKLDVFE